MIVWFKNKFIFQCFPIHLCHFRKRFSGRSICSAHRQLFSILFWGHVYTLLLFCNLRYLGSDLNARRKGQSLKGIPGCKPRRARQQTKGLTLLELSDIIYL